MFTGEKNRAITITTIALASWLGFFSTNCEKIEPVRLILIETGMVSEVSQTTCSVTATLFDVGGGTGVNQHGFCVSLTASVNDAFNCSQLGSKSQKGVFNGQITGLKPGTGYHVWAYASKGDETVYGKSVSFQTAQVEATTAQLTTNPVEAITWNSAVGGGTITSNGGSEITERGICWNVSPNPTIEDFNSSSESDLEVYTVQMTELTPETDYYVKAYAINGRGIAYGNEQAFSTLSEPEAPVVSTGEVVDETPTSATFNGTIINNGGASIVSKGFCWSTEPDPTLANESIEYGSGPEPYSMEVSGLIHDTEYYVRAYATNGAGKTGYGEVKIFRTLFLCGSILVDPRDGKQYATISIGDQCWMARNLDHGVTIPTSSEQADNESIEKYCYEDVPGNCEIYGGLYSWYEMMQYSLVEGSQGVCPQEWHVPSDSEWKTMEMALGMTEDEVNNEDWRGTDEGGKLKDTSSLWVNTAGATNSFQFSALPSGMVYEGGTSEGKGFYAVFWTSTPDGDLEAWYRYLHTDESQIYRVLGYRLHTTPVRCVKD